MDKKTAVFFDPKQEVEVKRKKALAQQLMQRAESIPLDNEMVSGIVVKRSPVEGLSKALQMGLGGYQEGQADKMEADQQAARAAKISEILSSGNNPELAQLAQIDPQMALEAKFKEMTQSNSTPAAMQMANEYLAALDAGDNRRAQALQEFAKTQDKGLIQLPDGSYAPLRGYGESLGQIGQATKYGEGIGSGMADLQMKPQIKAAEMQAENLINAQAELPQTMANSQQILDLIENVKTDKGLSASVGLRDPFKGALPFGLNIAGTPAADFQAKLDQLGGKQFLEAFQSLKGGGQITQIEGEKATNAIARMQTSQSEKAFMEALSEFEGIVRGAAERAQNKVGQPQVPMQSGSTPLPTGSIEDELRRRGLLK
jgi:hypothetical protein